MATTSSYKWYVSSCCGFFFQAESNNGWNPCFCNSTKARLATQSEILEVVGA